MEALELLKQDHQKVKQLFEQYQTAKDKKQQKQIFKELKTEIESGGGKAWICSRRLLLRIALCRSLS